jgi:hypothetical protein
MKKMSVRKKRKKIIKKKKEKERKKDEEKEAGEMKKREEVYDPTFLPFSSSLFSFSLIILSFPSFPGLLHFSLLVC